MTTIAIASIAPSGKGFAVESDANVAALPKTPDFRVNGKPVKVGPPRWCPNDDGKGTKGAPYQPWVYYRIIDLVLTPSDVATMDGEPVANLVGGTILPPIPKVPKTLRDGWNVGPAPWYMSSFPVFANLARHIAGWGGVGTLTPNGYPATITGPYAGALFTACLGNGVDGWGLQACEAGVWTLATRDPSEDPSGPSGSSVPIHRSLSVNGEGDTCVETSRSFNGADRVVTYQIGAGPGFHCPTVSLAMSAVGDCDLRVYPPGVATDGSELFHPAWREIHEGAACLRFVTAMFFGGGHPTAAIEYEDFQSESTLGWNMPKTTKGGVTLGPGIPPTIAVAMCNDRKADFWPCLPCGLTDDGVRQFARMVFSRLNPGLKWYLEYSNEIWDAGFPGQAYCTTHGALEGMGALEWGVKRSHECYSIAAEEAALAGRAGDLVWVLGSMGGWDAITRAIVTYLDLNKIPVPAIAVAPYFGYGAFAGPDEPTMEPVERTLDYDQKMDVAELFAKHGNWDAFVKPHRDILNSTGHGDVPLLCYEGGPQSGPRFGPPIGDLNLTDDQLAIHYSHAWTRHPRYFGIDLFHRQQWQDAGVTLACGFQSYGGIEGYVANAPDTGVNWTCHPSIHSRSGRGDGSDDKFVNATPGLSGIPYEDYRNLVSVRAAAVDYWRSLGTEEIDVAKTLKDLADAVAADRAAIDQDDKNMAAITAKRIADVAALKADTDALNAAVSVGPFFVLNPDGTATGYEPDGSGGVKPTTFKPGSTPIPESTPVPDRGPTPVSPAATP